MKMSFKKPRLHRLVSVVLLLSILCAFPGHFIDVSQAVAPDVVTVVTPTPGDGEVVLTWTNPASVDFTGTMVRVSTSAFPTTVSDGSLVSDVAGAPSGSSTVTHSGLENGTTYYYSLFSHNGTPEYSAAVNTQQLVMKSQFSEDFESLSIANIDGQNGWDAIGCSWSVVDTTGEQTLKSTAGTAGYETCRVLNGGTAATYSDQMIRADWKGSTTTTPGQVFLRAQSNSADAGGYFLWQATGTLRINYKTGSGTAQTQLTSAAFTPTAGVWYTYEFSVVNNSAGLPVLTGYVWQRGTSKPSTPTLQVTDTVNRLPQGVFSVGKTGTSLAEYDNVQFYGRMGDSAPTITSAITQNTLTWTNPVHADYVGSMVRYSTSAYPTSVTDGTLLSNVLGASGASSSVTHSDLVNGTQYYYTVFPYDNLGEYGTPLRLSQTVYPSLFTDDFTSSTLGDVTGQNAWSLQGGTWVVADSLGDQVLQATSTTTYPTNKATNGSIETTDQVLFTKFKSDSASNSAGYVWLRHQDNNSGYILWHSTNVWTISHYDSTGPTLTNLATSSSTAAAPMEANAWFNMEVSCINNGSDLPVLSIYVWKEGTEKPSAPTVSATDSINRFTRGTFALGRTAGAATVLYDDVAFFGSAPSLDITSPSAAVEAAPNVATLAITDEGGTFYIPYIQTSTTLTVNATAATLPDGGGIEFVLNEGLAGEDSMIDLTFPYSVSFAGLAKAEYTIDAYILEGDGVSRLPDPEYHDSRTDVGIGDIIAVIGDSVVEGLGGTVDDGVVTNWLDADAGTVSADNRNFPQHGIVTDTYNESFLTDLNDKLANYYGYPVFLMNEGRGSIGARSYEASVMSVAWRNRETALAANKWLIALGINDSRVSISAADFEIDMTDFISMLMTDFGATADNIWLSYPSYDFGMGLEPFYVNFSTYGTAYQNIREALGLQGGPDLFNVMKYYQADEYSDNVHPNALGDVRLAKLWFLSMIKPTLSSSDVMNDNTANLSWTSLSAYDPTIAGYRVSYGTSADNLDQTVDTALTTLSIPDLTDGSNYYFSVKAYDDNENQVSYSDDSTVIGPYLASIPDTAPDAPTIGTATRGNGQATVTFTAPASDGGSAITSYTVTSNPGGLTATGGSSPLTVSGLTNGTSYTFTVTATNAIGTGAASAASNAVVPQGESNSSGSSGSTVVFTPPSTNGTQTDETQGNNSSSGTSATSPFQDILESWARDAINDLYTRNVIEGRSSNSYEPELRITRAEFLKISLLNSGFEIGNYEEEPFSDVESEDWFGAYVSFAYKNGFVLGYEDLTFKPNEFINRAEAIELIMRINGKNSTDVRGEGSSFSDVTDTDWYWNAVVQASLDGILSSFEDGTFNPTEMLTRAEAADLAQKCYDAYLN